MKEALSYSFLAHSALFVLLLSFFTMSSVKPSNYYTIDLSISGEMSANAQAAAADAEPQPDIFEAERQIEKDFLQMRDKKQKAPPVIKQEPEPVKPRMRSFESARQGSGRGAGSAQAGVVISGGMGNFPYPRYMEIVQRKVELHWQADFWRQNLLSRKAQVAFFISADGKLSEVKIKQGSGDSIYDTACLRGVLSAAPLPSLPGELAATGVRVLFDFEISE
ncbi:MAG: TonB family protein [Elusimicrobiota bacterium]